MRHLVAMLAVALPAAFCHAQQDLAATTYGIRLSGEHDGYKVHRQFGVSGTQGSLELLRHTNRDNTHYWTDAYGGHTWSKLRAKLSLFLQPDSSPDALYYKARTKRKTSDRIRINAPARLGRPLKVYLLINLSGEFTGGMYDYGNMEAGYSTSISASAGGGGGSETTGHFWARWDNSQFFGTPPGDILLGPLNVTEGQYFDFDWNTMVRAEIEWEKGSVTGIIGDAHANCLHTFRVKGMVVKTNLDVNVPDFTVSSLQGIDWKKPSNPGELAALTVDDSEVVGGTTVTGSVEFAGRAEQGGQTVLLKSRNTAKATVPPEVVVPYLQTEQSFPISTSPVGASTNVEIVARMDGRTRVISITLTPPSPF